MEGFGSVLVPDSQAFLNIPSSNATESRPSQRKQSQAKPAVDRNWLLLPLVKIATYLFP